MCLCGRILAALCTVYSALYYISEPRKQKNVAQKCTCAECRRILAALFTVRDQFSTAICTSPRPAC